MAKKHLKLPTYNHDASTHAGIRERLTLVALVDQRTYATTPNVRSMVQPSGKYQHQVRLMCKSEGWEVNCVWTDDSKRITKEALRTHNVAIGIEAARANWHEARLVKHILKVRRYLGATGKAA